MTAPNPPKEIDVTNPERSETDWLSEVAGEARSVSRRKFLLTSGVVGAGVFLAACGNDDEGDEATDEDSSGEVSGADADVAAFAASLEVLAVNTYKAGLDAATSGQLGEVPPAVAEYATTAMGHHQEHLDAWNGVLSGAGRDEVSAPPSDLEATVNQKFGQVKDVAGLAGLALELEQIAADTYLAALPGLESGDAKKLAGSIQAVDRQHQAILLFALGRYPVPITFQTTESAATPA